MVKKKVTIEDLTIKKTMEIEKDDPLGLMVKEGSKMEEYPFRKEIENILKSLAMGGGTTSEILEEGEIGTPRGDPMEEEVTYNSIPKGLISTRSNLLTPNVMTQI